MKMPKWLSKIIGNNDEPTTVVETATVETVEIQRPETVEDVVETTKTSPGVNLRNPAQRKAEEPDPISQALAAVAAGSMNRNLEDCDSIFLECECGKKHFRHAGYLETIVPFVSGDGGKICNDSHAVKTCCSCRKSYVAIGSKVYDVTDQVDIDAWEKFEKVAHKTTGPGGQC